MTSLQSLKRVMEAALADACDREGGVADGWYTNSVMQKQADPRQFLLRTLALVIYVEC